MEKDRRQFKRFDSFVTFKYQITTKQNIQTGMGLSLDLSRGGMKITCNEGLKKGSRVDFQIDIPDDPSPVCGCGEVMWVKKGKADLDNPKTRDYDIGIRFLAVDPVDKFRVLDYAYNSWLEDKVNDYSDLENASSVA
jgi:c-di-GMP-binding flagellar brake protein YcgR